MAGTKYGEVGMSRSELRNPAMLEQVRRAPEKARELLLPGLDRWVAAVLEGLDYRNAYGARCLEVYAKAMGIVGEGMALTVNLWQSMGAQDEGHAKRLMDSALEAEGMDELAALAISEAWARSVRERHGMPLLVESPANTSSATVLDESPS